MTGNVKKLIFAVFVWHLMILIQSNQVFSFFSSTHSLVNQKFTQTNWEEDEEDEEEEDDSTVARNPHFY